jgi:hypothetical protein
MSDYYPNYLRTVGMKEVKRDHVLQLIVICLVAGLSFWSSMIIFDDEKALKDIGKNTDMNYTIAQIQIGVWVVILIFSFMKMFNS